MRFRACALLAMIPALLCGSVIDLVNAHLVLKDTKGALQEIKSNTSASSEELLKAKIKVYAASGNEHEMLAAWNQLTALQPELKDDRAIIEEMSWGVVEKGISSGSAISRIISAIAASMSGSAHGVKWLQHLLKDNNAAIRELSVELSAQQRDECLQDSVLALIQKETNWSVRLQAIRALGSMKCRKARPFLTKLLHQSNVTAAEKAAALQSLVILYEDAEERDLLNLASSEHSGLRELCSEVIGKLFLYQHAGFLKKLAYDPVSDVRFAAIQALGVLGVDAKEIAEAKIHDRDEEVAIAAAWLLTVQGNQKGSDYLYEQLQSKHQSTRMAASAALNASGAFGVEVAEKVFRNHSDPYIRLNAGLYLLNQQSLATRPDDMIYQIMSDSKDLWMWRERGIFRAIAPSTLRHRGEVARYPEAVDSMVRLEVLQTLAINEHPKALNAAKDYLRERSFGITGAATALLLTEGDQETLQIVKQLLHDPDTKISVQAALVLALWGRDEEVIDTLQKSYAFADRETRERILEGLGRVGTQSSLPFLIEKFDEPHQNLRIIAAAAALQCVHH